LDASERFVLLMLILTCGSQFGLSRGWQRFVPKRPLWILRPRKVRVRFDALHQWSTRIEGGVLLMGLAAVYLISKERVY